MARDPYNYDVHPLAAIGAGITPTSTSSRILIIILGILSMIFLTFEFLWQNNLVS